MKLTKSSFWFYPICATVVVSCDRPVNPVAGMEKPNILLIYTDDLNDRLGCYGDSIAITPNIDNLAKQGAMFRNAYCQQPLCGPSRSSMLTGFRPGTLGIHSLNKSLREKHPEIKTLPQVFREAGYFTGRSGKVFHQGVPDAIAQQSAGDDDPLAWDLAVDVPGYELNSNGHFYNATPWKTHRVGTGGAVSWLRAEKADATQHDYNVATEIIDMMDKADGKPFFLAAGFIRPHVPLVAPKRYFEMYDSIDISLPVSLENDRSDMPPMAYKSWAADFNISDKDTKEAIRAYYACISFVDDQIGRLLKALEEKGLAESTLVVFVSDHGYQLGSHDLWFKNYLFRESVIAPLIIKGPGVKSMKIDQVTELLDVFPSLCEFAGLDAPEGLEGQSFRGFLTGMENNLKDYAIIECRREKLIGKALYKQDWSLMDWGEGQNELYNLKEDPYQLTNLAGEFPGKVRELKQEMLLHLEKEHSGDH